MIDSYVERRETERNHGAWQPVVTITLDLF